jgi:polyisoprenyl-teichoic acid--peptidoglycan teichoic acid transferase
VSSFEAATTAIVPNNKLFKLLIIGSDARPNENFQRTRGDSLHVFVWNPAFNKGTIVGIPRDSYVTLKPSGKKGKINGALSTGGPQAMLDTVNALTGLGISNYVVTGFSGLQNMVNDIGGVNVLVSPGMKDVYSGAMFQNGWFAMNGKAALAYTRNRKTLPNGDFDRSANQGKFLLNTLAKMREEVSDVPGLVRWVNSFRKNAASNLKPTDLLVLSQMARSIDPSDIRNVVLGGKSGRVGGEDVVNLTPTYSGLFNDIGRDGVNDGR